MYIWLKAKNSKNSAQFILPVVSGILLSLPWLGFPGWILLFAFIPLFFSEKYFSETGENIKLFWAGVITFIVWNFISTGWMMSVNLTGSLLIILINSFFMSGVFLGFSLMRKKLIPVSGYFLFAVIWLSYEYYLIHGKPGWPWLVLGNGMGSSIWLVQWYKYTGVLGGSLWILTINILLFRFLSQRVRFVPFSQIGFSACIFLFLLLAPVVLSLFLLTKHTPFERSISVMVVQTNIDPYTQKFSAISNTEQFEQLMKISEVNIKDEVDLVVWPETALDSIWLDSGIDFRLRRISEFLSSNHTSLIFGAMSFSFVTKDVVPQNVIRRTDSKAYLVSNSAILMNEESFSEYRKNILVPGVETTPVFFHDFFNTGYIAHLGGVGGSLYTDYKKPTLMINDSSAVVPSICFESANGQHVAGFNPTAPFVLAIITNDGWFTRKYAYNQHLMMAQMRAIENSAGLIRCSNTGNSTLIDQKGRVVKKLPIGQEGVLYADAGLTNELTYYATHGDYIGRIALFLFVMACLMTLAQFLKSQNKL